MLRLGPTSIQTTSLHLVLPKFIRSLDLLTSIIFFQRLVSETLDQRCTHTIQFKLLTFQIALLEKKTTLVVLCGNNGFKLLCVQPAVLAHCQEPLT